jgi:hypothetical protein
MSTAVVPDKWETEPAHQPQECVIDNEILHVYDFCCFDTVTKDLQSNAGC